MSEQNFVPEQILKVFFKMEKQILEKLIAYCLKLISKRPQSTKEIKIKLSRLLVKKKVKNEKLYLEAILKYLKKAKYLNDKEFAFWFAAQRARFRPRSKKFLYSELKQKGIEEKIIEDVLNSYNEKKACNKLINKKRRLKQEKLISYLIRQGFSYDLIKTCY